MAAADYYKAVQAPSSMRTDEENLEIQAQDIERKTLLFQARLRGFLVRHRVSRHHKIDVAIENNGHLSSINRSSYRDTHSITSEMDERRNSSTNKMIAENDEHGDKYTQRDETYALDLWHKITSGKAESKLNKVQTSSSFSSIDQTAITAFPTTTEATLESAAKLWDEAAPWWIESPPDSKEGALCNICRRISFDTLLHTTVAYEPSIPLGTLQAVVRKIECSFCRLVAHTGSCILQSSIESLRSSGSIIYCELCGDFTWNRYTTRIRNLCLKLTLSLPNEDYEEIRYGWIQQILTSGEHPPEQKQNDSRLVKDQIDLELVKCWLETCKEQHNSTHLYSSLIYPSFIPDTPTDIHDPATSKIQPCQPIPVNTITFDLTLVDVRRECLVDMPLNTTYIALSYVWGGPQPFQNVMSRKQDLYSPHSISVDDEAIPRTIRDAIRLVTNLGEKYIWVDSLCICQDEMENKMNQIMNMGNIYSQALLTIVAASGSNANAGLPGVRAFSRNSIQRTECVQGMILANELPQLQDIIEQSYWNTRCWTYQEKELCRRCLIFCETHIFFQCNRTVFKEDSGLRDHAIAGERAKRIREERQPVWNSYRRAVIEYTKRTISDESDVVNAFQGIASLLQPAFKGDFLFGLPETELDIALLWQPNSLIRRRVNPETKAPLFPSWSWVGWIGEVTYRWNRHQLDDLSRVEWQCTDSEGGNIRFCTSNELRAPIYSSDHDSWEYIPDSRGTPYYYQHTNPDIWCLHPVAAKDKKSSYMLIQPGSHQLIFRAYTAFLRISSILSHTLGEKDRILCPLSIFDIDGFVAGKIYVPAQLIETLEGKHQEFVCLSRRRYGQLDEGPAPQSPEDDFKNIPDQVTLYPYSNCLRDKTDEFDARRYNRYKPWPLYNVMMIGWDNNGVASRIALGILHVTAFVQAKPMTKLITLA